MTHSHAHSHALPGGPAPLGPLAARVVVGVLGAPRLHCTIATGTIITKEGAGQYALNTFDREWHHLIYDVGLTIQTNLFGTTYYSLVGLHAFHVTLGLLLMCLTACFALLRNVTPAHAGRIEVLAIYWHFVDIVWVVVFTVVYLIGR